MSEKTDSIDRRLFKSGTFLFVGQVFELAISFIAALIIARYLGPTGYGAIAIGVAIVNGALSFLLLGLSGGIARYLPRYDDIRDQRGVVEREEVMLVLQFEDQFSVDLGPLKRLAAKLMDDVPTE